MDSSWLCIPPFATVSFGSWYGQQAQAYWLVRQQSECTHWLLIYKLICFGPTLIKHGKREANVTLCLLCNRKKLAVYICLIYREKQKHLLSMGTPTRKFKLQHCLLVQAWTEHWPVTCIWIQHLQVPQETSVAGHVKPEYQFAGFLGPFVYCLVRIVFQQAVSGLSKESTHLFCPSIFWKRKESLETPKAGTFHVTKEHFTKNWNTYKIPFQLYNLSQYFMLMFSRAISLAKQLSVMHSLPWKLPSYRHIWGSVFFYLWLYTDIIKYDKNKKRALIYPSIKIIWFKNSTSYFKQNQMRSSPHQILENSVHSAF